MPRFMAIYLMKSENVARFRAMPKADQDAVDAVGIKQWGEWEKNNAAAFLDRGGMVGKTLRVNKDGAAPATNDFCGYAIVEAESIEAAARIFENHPHFATFPGDSVDIMPFVTDPQT